VIVVKAPLFQLILKQSQLLSNFLKRIYLVERSFEILITLL